MELLYSFLDLHPYIVLLILLGICILEGLPIVGSFVAGGTVAVAVGTLVYTGQMDTGPAIIVCTLGSFIGDIVGYYTVKNFRTRIARFQKMIESLSNHQSRYSRFFDQHFFLVTIVSRLLPVVKSFSSIFAVIRSVHAPTYIVASFLASLLWATSSILIGYGAGKLFSPSIVFLIASAFIVIPTGYSIIRYLWNRKNKSV